MDATTGGKAVREPLTTDAILAAFDAAGMRNTRPRRVIAERLAEYSLRGDDFAIDDLWHQMHVESPHLGRATLFRAIDSLAELGVLDRVQLGNGTPRYRVCGKGHHHHFICTSCHGIEEIEVCIPERDLARAAEQAGFEIDRHVLDVYGRCARCRGSSACNGPSTWP